MSREDGIPPPEERIGRIDAWFGLVEFCQLKGIFGRDTASESRCKIRIKFTIRESQ